MFDCDGVLWNFDEAIPGSIETLNTLHEMGKKLYFVSNNSTKSRESVASQLNRLGYPADPKQAYPTSIVAPIFLQKYYPSVKKMFFIGMPLFRGILEDNGYEVIHITDITDSIDWNALEVDKGIDCVMMGFDLNFNYAAALYASKCVQTGIPFITTNKDPNFSNPSGMYPDCGTLVNFIETANDQEAILFGKPTAYLYEAIEAEHDIDKSRTLMVGDRLDTDMLFGDNVGVDTLLVETGVHKRKDVEELGIKPTYILDQLSSLLTL